MQNVFITGGTGYIGKRVINRLLERKHRVIAIVRAGSEHKVPEGAETIVADPFQADSFQFHIPANATFIQLLGVSHPSRRKAKQFRDIDLKSVQASAIAAAEARVDQFIYVSVATVPAPFMRAYQEIRREGEVFCVSKGLNCTFIRPWYVIGPGHWWPVLLLPMYGLAELVPPWRSRARAMGLVTINQMIATIVSAVETKPAALRAFEIRDIRSGGKLSAGN